MDLEQALRDSGWTIDGQSARKRMGDREAIIGATGKWYTIHIPTATLMARGHETSIGWAAIRAGKALQIYTEIPEGWRSVES